MEQPNFEQLNNEIVLAADTIVWTELTVKFLESREVRRRQTHAY